MSSPDHVRVRIGHLMRSRLAMTAALVALAATLGACSESDPEPTSAESGEEIPGGADPADVRVIDEWATALSEGDLEGAAGYFAIPSVAENGPVLVEIRELGVEAVDMNLSMLEVAARKLAWAGDRIPSTLPESRSCPLRTRPWTG